MSRAILCGLTVLASALPVFAQYPGAEAIPAGPWTGGMEVITPEFCREVLTVLAGDEMEGRATGTDGYEKAAQFLAEHFKNAGLKPVGDDGTYFQKVPFGRARVLDAKSSFSFEGKKGGKKVVEKLAFGKDLTCRPTEMSEQGAVVFLCGDESTMERPEDLTGAIVVAKGGIARAGGRLFGLALRHRPLMVLVVQGDECQSRWTPRGGRRGGRARLAMGSISEGAAQRLAEAADCPDALTAPESGVKVTRGKGTASVLVKEELDQSGVPNVVGYLEGSDPKLKNEMVIMGSHLDHIGVAADGRINNGADDDGSGSTALVALAHAFGKSETRPKRSLLFLAFCGEELGLVGSAYYADNPIFPLERAVCELQMDMIGRNEEHHPSENRTDETAEQNLKTLHLIGSDKISKALKETILDVNKHVGFEFEYDQEGVYTRSDHYNFAKKGVPIAFFFSGFHRDYHQPTDTVDKINFEKLSNTAKLVYLTAWRIADNKKRLPK